MLVTHELSQATVHGGAGTGSPTCVAGDRDTPRCESSWGGRAAPAIAAGPRFFGGKLGASRVVISVISANYSWDTVVIVCDSYFTNCWSSGKYIPTIV